MRAWSHATVTGRYYVHGLGDAVRTRCSPSAMIAVESRQAAFLEGRQETMVLGFHRLWVDVLFGWSFVGGMCMECHIGDITRTLKAMQRDAQGLERRGLVPMGTMTEASWAKDALCQLPIMQVDPITEGSTGRWRHFVR